MLLLSILFVVVLHTSCKNIPASVSIRQVFAGDVERNQDGAAGMEVGQNEVADIWERDAQTDGHHGKQECCIGLRRHLLVTLFLRCKNIHTSCANISIMGKQS